jgi:alcohol dehydrogenase class IV
MHDHIARTSGPDTEPAYDFVVPPAIHFGPGRIGELGRIAAALGETAWIVASRRGLSACGGLEWLVGLLADAGLEAALVAESAGEPTVEQVAAALAGLPPPRGRPVVVALGGGAAIDLAKVIDRLEGVGRGLPIVVPPLPVVAVPTTAGTGAEATRNAVISCPRRHFKKSMRSPLMVPRAALVDPVLTISCDRDVTAASGLDCITQLIESYVCRFRRPLPRAIVIEALPRAVAALPRVLADPGDLAARTSMSHAALVSGMALGNSGLGMAHGVAAALGVACGTPHGVACALMLPVAMRVNRRVAGADFAALERACDPAAAASDAAAADAFVARIEALCAAAGAPRRLADVGLGPERIAWLAGNSGGASMRGNPVELDASELEEILAAVA